MAATGRVGDPGGAEGGRGLVFPGRASPASEMPSGIGRAAAVDTAEPREPSWYAPAPFGRLGLALQPHPQRWCLLPSAPEHLATCSPLEPGELPADGHARSARLVTPAERWWITVRLLHEVMVAVTRDAKHAATGVSPRGRRPASSSPLARRSGAPQALDPAPRHTPARVPFEAGGRRRGARGRQSEHRTRPSPRGRDVSCAPRWRTRCDSSPAGAACRQVEDRALVDCRRFPTWPGWSRPSPAPRAARIQRFDRRPDPPPSPAAQPHRVHRMAVVVR